MIRRKAREAYPRFLRKGIEIDSFFHPWYHNHEKQEGNIEKNQNTQSPPKLSNSGKGSNNQRQEQKDANKQIFHTII